MAKSYIHIATSTNEILQQTLPTCQPFMILQESSGMKGYEGGMK